MDSSKEQQQTGDDGVSSKKTILDRSIIILLKGPKDSSLPSLSSLSPSSTEEATTHSCPQQQQQQQQQRLRIDQLQGTSLIRSASQMLQLSTSCFATACTLFHRYWYAVTTRTTTTATSSNDKTKIENQQDNHMDDVWSVSMASVLIAAKIQEIPLTIKQVIVIFAHLYRKRRLLYIPDDTLVQTMIQQNVVFTTRPSASVPVEANWTWSQKQQFLVPSPQRMQVMSPMGPVWKEWCQAITKTENLILRQLGFVVYWIPSQHPHKYLQSLMDQVVFCSSFKHNTNHYHSPKAAPPPTTTAILEDEMSQHHHQQRVRVQRRAWSYCNDSFLVDLCLRYPPRVIACAAVYLACLEEVAICKHHHRLGPKTENKRVSSSGSCCCKVLSQWLHVPNWTLRLCGGTTKHMAAVAQTLLQLQDAAKLDKSSGHHSHHDLDVLVALHAFVPPLPIKQQPGVVSSSFNGPHSFLWDFANDVALRAQALFNQAALAAAVAAVGGSGAHTSRGDEDKNDAV